MDQAGQGRINKLMCVLKCQPPKIQRKKAVIAIQQLFATDSTWDMTIHQEEDKLNSTVNQQFGLGCTQS